MEQFRYPRRARKRAKMIEPTDDEELGARLAAVSEGPWSKAAKLAYDFLKPPFDLGKEYPTSQEIIDLTQIQVNSAHTHDVRHILRAHWEKAVEDPKERKIRASLDEALTTLELWELAVSSGYLPLEAIRAPARAAFVELFWSEGARAFTKYYGYATIPMLATRVGVKFGPKQVTPPKPIQSRGQRFASFLAEIRAWDSDIDLQKWLHFLDGFRPKNLPKPGSHLKKLLQGEAPPPAYLDYLSSLVSGAQMYRLRLSEFAETLEAQERPLYGSFFAYLLARFHGYLGGPNGFQPAKTNWSAEFGRAFDEDEFQGKLTVTLQGFWSETLEFLRSAEH